MPIVELKDLKGKFHAHITVLCKHLPALEAKAKANKAKCTVIHLEKDDQFQIDVMVTKYFFIKQDEDKTVFDFLDDLKVISADIESGGMKVLRIKIEHEDLPTLTPSQDNYWEMHYKCKIPTSEGGLVEEAVKGGILECMPILVASSNPFSTSKDYVIQFFNLRVYEGTPEEVLAIHDAHIGALSVILAAFDGELVESKREVIVYDSNHDHDKWWA